MSLDPAKVESSMRIELYTKYSSFIPAGYISKTNSVTLVLNVLKVEANSNFTSSAAPRASAVIGTINIWAVSPLNPMSSSFAKALDNE